MFDHRMPHRDSTLRHRYAPDRTSAKSPTGELLQQFIDCRAATKHLVSTLEPEDFALQGMADASPPKWHLAHTSWFFDTFVLAPFQKGYKPHHDRYHYLYNSYYVGEGEVFARAKRGLISRPSLADVFSYRQWVDEQIVLLVKEQTMQLEPAAREQLLQRVLLGLHHEYQHQELIITDITYSLFQNPLLPSLLPPRTQTRADRQVNRSAPSLDWIGYPSAVVEVGKPPPRARLDMASFAFDNESPRHKVYRPTIELADRLVTNAEYAAFIEDGGYRRPELWLSEGYHQINQQGIRAPLYWLRESQLDSSAPQRGLNQNSPDPEGAWYRYGIRGVQPLLPDAPVSHISYFEADAYARWYDARLPTEHEWESAVHDQPIRGNLLDSQSITEAQPVALTDQQPLRQAFGDVWEWTSSSYAPYPGFRTAAGSIGEYNGKFMVNQYVLKGGSSFTPAHHIRASYRNFFPSLSRWQNAGLRLAKDTS